MGRFFLATAIVVLIGCSGPGSVVEDHPTIRIRLVPAKDHQWSDYSSCVFVVAEMWARAHGIEHCAPMWTNSGVSKVYFARSDDFTVPNREHGYVAILALYEDHWGFVFHSSPKAAYEEEAELDPPRSDAPNAGAAWQALAEGDPSDKEKQGAVKSARRVLNELEPSARERIRDHIASRVTAENRRVWDRWARVEIDLGD